MPAIVEMCSAVAASIDVYLKISCVPLLWYDYLSNDPFLFVFFLVAGLTPSLFLFLTTATTCASFIRDHIDGL